MRASPWLQQLEVLDVSATAADMTTLTNFNISVAATDDFMDAVQNGGDYDLVNPHSGAIVGRRDARRSSTNSSPRSCPRDIRQMSESGV